jgi:purine-binding chemotaxis protein CheW
MKKSLQPSLQQSIKPSLKKAITQDLTLIDQSNALTMYLQALLNETEVEADSQDADSLEADVLEEEVDLFLRGDEPEPESETELKPFAATPAQKDSTNAPAVFATSMQTPGLTPTAIPVVTSSKAPVAYVEVFAATERESGIENESASVPIDTPVVGASIQAKAQNEPPVWAVPRFQVLTFSLADLQIAAPLDKLNGIIPMPDRITSLPGHSPWFLGLARNRDKNVQIVDLGKIIMPVRRPGANAGPGDSRQRDSERKKYILLMDEGRWGIVCDTISTVLALDSEQVSWRRSSHFDFFLGTVVEKMYSILCVERLVERLNGRSI